MENLFVYGTLKDPDIQKQVFGRSTPGTPDLLPGYSMSAIDINGETYPIAFPKEGKEIEGLVLQVSIAELTKTDEWESDTYQRVKVTLKSGKQAWVYSASEQVLNAYGKLLGL
jgi:gamma-glutamylcyclotransferase (GGCT)/AIG2-like uncharacterized protein YtfP